MIEPQVDTNNKSFPLASVLLAALLAISLGFSGLIFWQNQQLKTEITRLTNDIEATEPSPSPAIKLTGLDQFKTQLKLIFEGDVKYGTEPNSSNYGPMYQIEIDIPKQNQIELEKSQPSDGTVVILARKYTPGFVAKMGYEGSEWEVNFDDWVNYLQKLTPATKKVVRVSSWGKGEQSTPILVKKWGEYTFGIYDSYFKPAGNTDRNFVTYDFKNKQIVEVIARDYPVETDYVENSAIHKYDTATEDLFLSIEKVLANTLSQTTLSPTITDTASPSPLATSKTTNNDWQYFDNQCFSIKYPMDWGYKSDNTVNNSPETGIAWTDIFFNKTNNKNMASITMATNGTLFDFAKYKSKTFPNINPKISNGKQLYELNGKYLIETNCKDHYVLIDTIDIDSKNTIKEIVDSLE